MIKCPGVVSRVQKKVNEKFFHKISINVFDIFAPELFWKYFSFA